MTAADNNHFLVKAAVKHTHSVDASTDTVFEYLSDVKRLLINIPDLSKLQFYKNSGRARLFCSMRLMRFMVHVVVDIESTIDPQTQTVKLIRPVVPHGDLPDGFLVGTFGAKLQLIPEANNTTQIVSKIKLGFEPTQMELFKRLPRFLLETPGQIMLQDFVEQTSLNYINKLAKEFPKWQGSLKQA